MTMSIDALIFQLMLQLYAHDTKRMEKSELIDAVNKRLASDAVLDTALFRAIKVGMLYETLDNKLALTKKASTTLQLLKN